MSFNFQKTCVLVSCAAVAALIAGCGTDEDTITKKETSSTTTVAQKETPAPAPVANTEEAVTPAQQPVGEVTYAIAERALTAADGPSSHTLHRKKPAPVRHYMLVCPRGKTASSTSRR
jgi:hypothetical protein